MVRFTGLFSPPSKLIGSPAREKLKPHSPIRKELQESGSCKGDSSLRAEE
jgi:hypothetical protein